MPRPRNSFPTYRKHKQSQQAIVTVRTALGRRKDVVLGKYGSAESKAEFARICAVEAMRAGSGADSETSATIAEVILPFIEHVDQHHRRADGTTTHETTEYRNALRPLRELYGPTLANEFGPLKLQVVREAMISLGWCRGLINRRIGRVKRLFKWAASQELVPATVFHALQTVPGLQRGRSNAKEREPVKPVDEAVVMATLPYLPRHVAGLVRFQLLTGCRPGEACTLRRCDLETVGAVWLYRPPAHKLAYRNESRVIALGPRAQALLEEFPTRDADETIFSPSRALAEARADWTPAMHRRNERKVELRAERRKEKTGSTDYEKEPQASYSTLAYGRSIAKCIKLANTKREKDNQIPHWHPNQLRHTKGTAVRKAYGLEAAQVLLGHSKADTTQIYAERNLALAVKIAGEVG